jgi:uncharacterized repeat protein (TIGR01451 family)
MNPVGLGKLCHFIDPGRNLAVHRGKGGEMLRGCCHEESLGKGDLTAKDDRWPGASPSALIALKVRQRCLSIQRHTFVFKYLIMNTLQYTRIMSKRESNGCACGVFLALSFAVIAAAQAPSSSLEIKAIAEVESRSVVAGAAVVKLIPADRVVPGDRVIYTLEVRNTGATALDTPAFNHPIPEHMQYMANSAVGPGAEVSYSVDGGRSFDHAENLSATGADGRPRRAVAADYTDIRWQLKKSLKANSVAFVRFRALVK